MKKNQVVIYVAAASALALILSACSGGGQQTIPGNQCPADYKPGFVDDRTTQIPPQFQKGIALKPDGTMDLDPGIYNYSYTDFYYEDDQYAPNNNFRILVQDVATSNSTVYEATRSCVRNARANMGQIGLSVSAKGLSKLEIGGDHKPVTDALESKSFGFSISADGTIVPTSAVLTNEKPSLPSDPFGTDLSNSYIYVHPDNANAIEVRSSGRSATGTWHLSTTFIRVDLPTTTP